MVIELDGRAMRDHAAAHAHLRERLGFPDWYGCNLDALHDLLTERGEETTLLLCHQEDMVRQLGPYAGALLEVLRHAAQVNPNLRFDWE